MEITPSMLKKLQEDLSNAKTLEQLLGKDGAIKNLLKGIIESMYEGEITEHLGYEKYSPEGKGTGNSRNGTSQKTLKTEYGDLKVNIPRDRNGDYDPILLGKYKKDIGAIEDKVISMYAKGMSTRDIQSHIEEIYGIDLSPSMISNITDKVMEAVKQWQARPLEPIYPIVFFDAIHFKVRSEGRVINKAAYTSLAIDITGHKDMLGIWIAEAEGAHFWLSVFTELKNRGLNDILIACVDGLKGFPEAINSVFPKAIVQLCVIHEIRNTLRRISSRERALFMRDLKPVYQAPTLEAAELQLDNLESRWGHKYSSAIKIWREDWVNLSTYLSYPEELRQIIYTTNTVEALHRQFRKVTKSKALFPNDESLRKMLYLSYQNIAVKWKMSLVKWQVVLNQLNIIFKDRLSEYY